MKFKQLIYLQAFKMCYAQHDAYLLHYLLSSTQHACFDHYCLQNVAFETKFLRSFFKMHFGAQLSEPCNLTTCQIIFNNMVKSQIVDRKNTRKNLVNNPIFATQQTLPVFPPAPSRSEDTGIVFSKRTHVDDVVSESWHSFRDGQNQQSTQHLVFEQNLNKSHLLKQVKQSQRLPVFSFNKIKCCENKSILIKNKICTISFLPVLEKQTLFNSLKQTFSKSHVNVLAIAQLSNGRLMNGQWILQYLIKQLVGKKSVKPIVNNLLRTASKLMRTKYCSNQLLGLKITLTGRLGARKKGMAQQLCRSIGRVPHSTLSQKVTLNQGFINTVLGTVGVKVWVCYA